ncbi:MAG: hypothetical protein FIB08_06150 [Candidatus Methanoperedens sp.]|nr:hypothetical protein [Candidatus Methanoperedens sp.]
MPDESRIPEIGLFGLMRRGWLKSHSFTLLKAIGVLMLVEKKEIRPNPMTLGIRRMKSIKIKNS